MEYKNELYLADTLEEIRSTDDGALYSISGANKFSCVWKISDELEILHMGNDKSFILSEKSKEKTLSAPLMSDEKKRTFRYIGKTTRKDRKPIKRTC